MPAGTITTSDKVIFDDVDDSNATKSSTVSDLLALVTTGSMVLLDTQTASTSANIDFSSSITGTYTHYRVVLESVLPATDDVRMGIQYSQSSTFITSGYAWINDDVRNGTAFVGNSTSDTRIYCHGEGVSNVSTEGGFNATIDFYDVGASKQTSVAGYTFSQSAAATTWDLSKFGGALVSTTAIDGIRFLFASGNITSGTFKIYGIS